MLSVHLFHLFPIPHIKQQCHIGHNLLLNSSLCLVHPSELGICAGLCSVLALIWVTPLLEICPCAHICKLLDDLHMFVALQCQVFQMFTIPHITTPSHWLLPFTKLSTVFGTPSWIRKLCWLDSTVTVKWKIKLAFICPVVFLINWIIFPTVPVNVTNFILCYSC
jgi:hypothetical protein